jgi:HlyD family secretion protein
MSTQLDSEVRTRIPVQPIDDEFAMPSKSRRVLRGLAWTGVLLLIAAGVAFFIYRRAHAVPVVHYETSAIDRGTIAAKVTATGTLTALLTVQVGAQVSGRVQQHFVDYNSAVKKGETIAKLDPVLFQAALAQSNANLLTVQGVLKKDQAQEINAQAIYNRTLALQEAGVSAHADLDTAKANFDAAKAQVEADESNLKSAEALLSQAQTNLGYTTVVSPIDGVVISRNVDVGQTVAASFQAPTLFVIAQDLHHMQVDTNVGEGDVGRLYAGMKATFTVDAFPGRQFVGNLRQIRNAAQTLQNVVTYDSVIDVENPNLLLRPGMTANTTFVAAQKDDVVRLKNAALRFEPDAALLKRIGIQDTAAQAVTGNTSRRKVWVLRVGKPVSEIVSVGVTDGTFTEMTQGDLRPGDMLITDMTTGQ